jgi:hypothetical protein
MTKLTIDLGKGVKLTAPINLSMTADEWQRMTSYINNLINQRNVKR